MAPIIHQIIISLLINTDTQFSSTLLQLHAPILAPPHVTKYPPAIFETLTTIITSFCLVGHWSIQCLSFSFCFYTHHTYIRFAAPQGMINKASRTSIARMSHLHHHHHEREQHEEGHQTRHGCQYVVCSPC